jgi:hypothetical protein
MMASGGNGCGVGAAVGVGVACARGVGVTGGGVLKDVAGVQPATATSAASIANLGVLSI